VDFELLSKQITNFSNVETRNFHRCMNSFMRNCARGDPKRRRLQEVSSRIICGAGFKEKDVVFSGAATAGNTCLGGSLDGEYGIFAGDLTEGECISGGGKWETHTCESIGNYLYESAAAEKDGVTEEMRQSAIANFLAPSCCQAAAVH